MGDIRPPTPCGGGEPEEASSGEKKSLPELSDSSTRAPPGAGRRGGGGGPPWLSSVKPFSSEELPSASASKMSSSIPGKGSAMTCLAGWGHIHGGCFED